MVSTYVNNLRLNEMGTGDQSGSWGTVTNTNLELIGEALGYGTEAITTNADTHATTVADGSTDPGRAMFIKYTGTLDSACTITIGPDTLKRLHVIENATSGSQNILIKQGSGGGASVTIPNGHTKIVYLDGGGSGAIVTDATTDLNVDTNLYIKNPGTGDDSTAHLYLQTAETDIAINDVIGKINFQAPDEGTGTDANLVAAAIAAISEGDFSSSSNATKLSFMTGSSEAAAEKASLSSGGNLDVTGDITGSTLNADGDTSAGDAAAIGYTASLGIIVTGQGSTNDITLVNDADATVLAVPTGTTNVDIVGVATAETFEPDGDTAAGDNAAIGYTSAEGLILTGQGSTNDVTIKNDADADVIEIPTGTTNVTVAGTLGTGGLITSGAGLSIADGGTIGVASDSDVLTIASTGVSTFSKAVVGSTDTDTSNTGSVTLDFNTNQNFVLTFTGNVTLANPSTESVGQSGIIVCIQDGTGSRTLSLGTDYETAGGAGITLSTAASAVDVIPYFVKASGSIQLGAVQKAFS
jgi:fibronectin-binding autotransporter adhesin